MYVPELKQQAGAYQGGRGIYEKFFKQFTIKQWGVSPAEIDPSVIKRIPFRKNRDIRTIQSMDIQECVKTWSGTGTYLCF